LQLTDAISADLASTDVTGFRFEGERFDCGSIQGFVQATVAFAMDRPELEGDLGAFLGRFTTSMRHAA
jgi:UTP--glucose-1-phosphate uridylyltransferase